jgi:hypothetical protein
MSIRSSAASTVFSGRRSLAPSSLSVSFFSDAASTLTAARRRVSRRLVPTPASSHARALQLATVICTAHAHRHGHTSTTQLLVTVCHDICERCHAPYLDVLDEALCTQIERHLVGLIHDLAYAVPISPSPIYAD